MPSQKRALSGPFAAEFPDHVGLIAARWVRILQSAVDQERLREPFEQWLAADPANHRAFRAMRITWAFRRYAKSQKSRAAVMELEAIVQGRRPIFGTH